MKIETFKRIKFGVISSLTSLITSLILALVIVGANHFFQALMLIFIVLATSTGIAFVVGFLANNSWWLNSIIYGIIVSLLTVGSIVLWSVSNI